MSLLKCVAKSLVKNLGNFGGNFIGVPVAGSIVTDAWDRWEKETDEKIRRREVEDLAQMKVERLCEQIKEIIAEQSAGLVQQQQQVLAEYLQQVPAGIRRSLRRPADPSGTTVPGGMHLRGPNDLLGLLPPRLPRFRPGTRPWEHSDLTLVELLGQGGFGEVWKAKHLDRPLAPPVAIKFCIDNQAVNSLVREKDLLDRVARIGRHDGIVQLLYVHLRNDPPALEYEYVEGGELTRLISALHADGPPSPEKVAGIMLELARIVAFAHEQKPPLVHRDLKPANILVSENGKGYQFKIADFGIGAIASSLAINGVRSGQTGLPEGNAMMVSGAYTPLYASPQQMKGEAPDPRDDVHALGVIWYQLLTNRMGLQQLPSDWRQDLKAVATPKAHEGLLASCMASIAEWRPADAAEFAVRLQFSNLIQRATSSGSQGPDHASFAISYLWAGFLWFGYGLLALLGCIGLGAVGFYTGIFRLDLLCPLWLFPLLCTACVVGFFNCGYRTLKYRHEVVFTQREVEFPLAPESLERLTVPYAEILQIVIGPDSKYIELRTATQSFRLHKRWWLTERPYKGVIALISQKTGLQVMVLAGSSVSPRCPDRRQPDE